LSEIDGKYIKIMSKIRKALEHLDRAIGDLEEASMSLEVNASGAQGDMFPETKQAVVKSLDAMINHVENMLEEA
tara:strand:- start:43213 stop:43434 length:222 start_codon:yes stop_codon:yes gene_type:complete